MKANKVRFLCIFFYNPRGVALDQESDFIKILAGKSIYLHD